MTTSDFDFPGILTRVVAAIVILIVTLLVAKLVKKVLGTQLSKISALQRHDSSGNTLGESLATIVSLIVWLFGLIAILNLFNLTQVVAPIQGLLDGILSVLPGIIGAALVFFVGFVLAKIVRQIVETSLEAMGADSWLSKAQSGTSSSTETASSGHAAPSASSAPSLSAIAGQLVFTLILVVVSISALQVLGIDAISVPATQMLSLILDTIPAILSAAILLGIGYLVGKLVAPLLESMLRGFGLDKAMSDIGVSTGSSSASALIGRLAHVAIVLFFAIAATRVLGFSEITAILDTVLQIGGQVLFGGAVIAVGVLVARVLSRLASGQSSQILYWATIGLFVAMGLQFMGLADTIVNLAFGSVVVGTALAAALAFGLGGRDAAARQLERMQERRPATTGSGPESSTTSSTTSGTTSGTTSSSTPSSTGTSFGTEGSTSGI